MRAFLVYAGDPLNVRQVAPYTITSHVYRALIDAGFEVIYYNWDHRGPVQDVRPDDIVLGHAHYDANTALRRLFQYKCRLKCMIQPFHHAMPEINLPFDDVVAQADIVFSICGPHWYNTIEQSRFAHWKPKITRLDMAVDAGQFPYLKKSFNDPGQRSYAYIGRSEREKGTDILAATFKYLPEYKLHVYGSINGGDPLLSMSNVVIHGWTDICHQWLVEFANQCDFVVNMGRSDANPTVQLEAASLGLIPACTPESGYCNDRMFTQLDGQDPRKSAKILKDLNNELGTILIARAHQSRIKIETYYTWDNFCGTIIKTIRSRLEL